MITRVVHSAALALPWPGTATPGARLGRGAATPPARFVAPAARAFSPGLHGSGALP